MSVSAHEVERRMALSSEAFREGGLRLTHQRLEVAREVAGSDAHPDVETIYRGVKERVPTISLDTVYRTLRTLENRGLVTRVNATSGPARYDANLEPHHHFVCTRCGMVRDVVDPNLDTVRAPKTTLNIGAVDSVEVQLRGVCKTCSAGKGS